MGFLGVQVSEMRPLPFKRGSMCATCFSMGVRNNVPKRLD